MQLQAHRKRLAIVMPIDFLKRKLTSAYLFQTPMQKQIFLVGSA